MNALEPLAHYGPTVFSDMEPEEYLSGYTASDIPLPELDVDMSVEVATSQDWTGIYTSPVKDQGSCGSCWAESAISQVESDAMREHGWTGVLSVQELVDCTEDGQGSSRFGCGGGNPIPGYQVLQAVGGAASGYDYLYTAKSGVCKIDNYQKYVNVKSYHNVGTKDEAAMKAYISSTGPLSVCVDANSWGGYSGGIKTSCGKSIDHCVQLVGYGTEHGTDYWKVRNSWGGDWGEEGFIRLQIGKDLCKISNGPTAVSTTVVAPAPVPSPSPECSDLPLGWKSSEGDPCSIYQLNSYCTPEGREGAGWDSCSWGPITDYADSHGISALDACCACGGGSNPAPPTPPPPSPPSTCTDHPSNWRSSEGDSCCTYVFSDYCSADGTEGPGWDHASWGPISDYADSQGRSALDACCGCGGGSRSESSVVV